MISNKVVVMLTLAMMLVSGCTGVIDEPIDTPDVTLPSDWSTAVSRTVSNPQLSGFADCQALEDSLKQSIAEEYRTQILQAAEEVYYYGGFWMDDTAEMAMDGAATGSANGQTRSASPPREEGKDFSGTNNQEEGVDEADFVKTDGYFIYFLNGNRLEILGVPDFGTITYESNFTIEGTPQAMMLDGDRLVVISTVSPWSIPQDSPLRAELGWTDGYQGWRTEGLTKFTVLDITNRSDPVIGKELFLEGYYMTAREVNATVRTVTHTWLNIPGVQSWLDLPSGYWNLDYDDPRRVDIRHKVAYQTIMDNQEVLDSLTLEEILPRVYERQDGVLTVHQMSDGECADFVAPSDGFNRGFTSIFTMDLADENFAFEADHIVGNYPQVYSSQDVLIITENAWDWWWFWGSDTEMMESTNIHTFDISASGETLYTGSGRVDGQILDQFSLSEHEGVVRVATTVGQWGRWWLEDPEPMSSQVVTLGRAVDDAGNQILVELGKLEGIAEGERIWSTRFDGDRVYIVTFMQIDPLWIIDLSDETNPTILGELEVPGVSTYIHPLSKDQLLTIGMGPANEDGTGLDWSNVRISLFDVSNTSSPSLADVFSISPVQNPNDTSWQWSYSEATYEHKAFQYWAPKGLLAVPISTYRYNTWYDDNGQYYWSYQYVSKLALVNVSEETGELSLYGTVDHSDLYNREDNQYYWGEYNIRRSIFMGDYVYAISSAGVSVTNLTTMDDVATLKLEQPTYDSYNYYGEGDVAVAETSSEDAKDE